MTEEEQRPSDAQGAVGAVLNGEWKLLRVIGEGGLAAVYEAEGLRGQGRRAVKLLFPMFCTRQGVVDRFRVEAETCYTLRHPHIASVESYGCAEDGSPYIVMELLEGVSLEEFLLGGHTMSVEQAVPILYGVLQALTVAHARGVVHRDLKPANIFLVREPDGRFTPKVLDFGVAKVMDLAGGMGTKTRTGALLGTPGYMSPEQVKDAKAVDLRTDLWSVAVVFYEMLTCHHPFESSDKLARMVAVLRDEPRPITQFRPDLGHWRPFFDQGLAKSPTDRFGSAEEMIEALRTTSQQASEPVRAVGQQTVALPQVPGDPGPAAPGEGPAASRAAAESKVRPGSVAAAPSTHASVYGAASPGVGSTAPDAGPGTTRPDDRSWPIELGQPRPAGAGGGPPGASTRTQISGDRPAGTPTFISGRPPPPEVAVVTAPDVEPASLVWWAVVLVGLGCLGLGIVVGYLLAS